MINDENVKVSRAPKNQIQREIETPQSRAENGAAPKEFDRKPVALDRYLKVFSCEIQVYVHSPGIDAPERVSGKQWEGS